MTSQFPPLSLLLMWNLIISISGSGLCAAANQEEHISDWCMVEACTILSLQIWLRNRSC